MDYFTSHLDVYQSIEDAFFFAVLGKVLTVIRNGDEIREKVGCHGCYEQAGDGLAHIVHRGMDRPLERAGVANDGSVNSALRLSFVNQTQSGCICLKKKTKSKTPFEVEEMLVVFHSF